MSDPRHKHGAFSWFELMTEKVEEAKTFYSQLFGWTLEEMPMSNGSYWVIKVDEMPVAGLMKKPPQAVAAGAPCYWNTYITVENVDQTAEEAKALGATIVVPPTHIPSVGRFCVIQDPQGTVISAITYEPCNCSCSCSCHENH
jgi:predicted enzyme related to lactoylglutathione lyase